jgi:hypothetical protein
MQAEPTGIREDSFGIAIRRTMRCAKDDGPTRGDGHTAGAPVPAAQRRVPVPDRGARRGVPDHRGALRTRSAGVLQRFVPR